MTKPSLTPIPQESQYGTSNSSPKKQTHLSTNPSPPNIGTHLALALPFPFPSVTNVSNSSPNANRGATAAITASLNNLPFRPPWLDDDAAEELEVECDEEDDDPPMRSNRSCNFLDTNGIFTPASAPCASNRVGCRIRNVACAVCKRESSERRVRVCMVQVSAEKGGAASLDDDAEEAKVSSVSCRISLTGDLASSSWPIAHQSIDSPSGLYGAVGVRISMSSKAMLCAAASSVSAARAKDGVTSVSARSVRFARA